MMTAVLDGQQIFWLVLTGLFVLLGGGSILGFVVIVMKREGPLPTSIYLVTVLAVIYGAAILALSGLASGEATLSVFGVIGGYVLGAFGRRVNGQG